MTPSIRPVLALALACALAACQREAAPPPAAAPSAAPAPAPATPAAVAPAATATAASAESVGVADCDDYLSRYEACLAGKVPDSVKPTLQQSLAHRFVLEERNIAAVEVQVDQRIAGQSR